MSNWDDNEDEASQLVKDLRKQIKTLTEQKAELATEVSTLRPQVRKTSVKEILSELSVNPKIAALVPESVDTTRDAVKAWLDEFGDVFGATKAEEQKPEEKPAEITPLAGQTTQVVDQATQDAWARVQSAESGAGSSTLDIEQQQLAQLGAALTNAGGSFDAFIANLRTT